MQRIRNFLYNVYNKNLAGQAKTGRRVNFGLTHFGGYTMTRLVISISSFLLFTFFGLIPIFAAEEEKKPADSIHQAVVVGDVNQVQQLLSKGVDIHPPDPYFSIFV